MVCIRFCTQKQISSELVFSFMLGENAVSCQYDTCRNNEVHILFFHFFLFCYNSFDGSVIFTNNNKELFHAFLFNKWTRTSRCKDFYKFLFNSIGDKQLHKSFRFCLRLLYRNFGLSFIDNKKSRPNIKEIIQQLGNIFRDIGNFFNCTYCCQFLSGNCLGRILSSKFERFRRNFHPTNIHLFAFSDCRNTRIGSHSIFQFPNLLLDSDMCFQLLFFYAFLHQCFLHLCIL